MNITFTFLESLRSETSPESLSKMQLLGTKHHTKGVDHRKLSRGDVFAFFRHFFYIYIYIQIKKLFIFIYKFAFIE